MSAPPGPAAGGVAGGWLAAVRLSAGVGLALVVARAAWLAGYRHIASLGPWVPPAILLAALALLPYVAVLLLLARNENRKRGLALAMAWGALVCAAAVAAYGPALRDAARDLLPGQHAIVHHYFAGTRYLLDRLDALAGFALAVTAARVWAGRVRAREDFRMLLWGISFAVLYFLILRMLLRMLIPGNLPGVLP